MRPFFYVMRPIIDTISGILMKARVLDTKTAAAAFSGWTLSVVERTIVFAAMGMKERRVRTLAISVERA